MPHRYNVELPMAPGRPASPTDPEACSLFRRGPKCACPLGGLERLPRLAEGADDGALVVDRHSGRCVHRACRVRHRQVDEGAAAGPNERVCDAGHRVAGVRLAEPAGRLSDPPAVLQTARIVFLEEANRVVTFPVNGS